VLFAKYNRNYQDEEYEVDRAYSANEEKKNLYSIFVRKAEGKRPLERPRSRWVDNIKMALVGMRWGGVDLIGVAQDKKWQALMNAVMNLLFQ
jgi:hypothetical protein